MDFERGLQLFRGRNFVAALQIWEELARKGEGPAHLDLYITAARHEHRQILSSACQFAADMGWDLEEEGSILKEARKAMEGQRVEEALTHLEEDVIQRPEATRPRLLAARLLAAQGRSAEARAHLARARELGSEDASLEESMGFVELREDRLEAAQAHFQRAIAGSPNLASAWYGLGDVKLRLHRLTQARDCLVRARELAPRASTITDLLEHVEQDIQRARNRLQQLERDLDEHPDYADWQFEAARLHLSLGEAGAAGEALDRALEQNPCYLAALRLRASLRLESGDAEGALADLELAAGKTVPSDPAELHRASELRHQGDLVAAAQACLRSLPIPPDYASRHIEAARIFLAEGDPAQAEREAERAAALAPDYADAHQTLGAIALTRSRWDRALDSFERALQLNPRYLQAGLGLAEAQMERGDLDAAEATLGRFAEAAEGSESTKRRHDALALKLSEKRTRLSS